MILTFNEEVKLRVDRCGRCGRFFAVEQFVVAMCPYCRGQDSIDLETENARLKRSNAALKGHRKS